MAILLAIVFCLGVWTGVSLSYKADYPTAKQSEVAAVNGPVAFVVAVVAFITGIGVGTGSWALWQAIRHQRQPKWAPGPNAGWKRHDQQAIAIDNPLLDEDIADFIQGWGW